MLEKPLLQSAFSYTWACYCEDHDPIVTILQNGLCDGPPRDGVPDNQPSLTLLLNIIIRGQMAEHRIKSWFETLIEDVDLEDVRELLKVPRKVLRDTGVVLHSSSQRYPLYKSALAVQRVLNDCIIEMQGGDSEDSMMNKALEEAVEPTSCLVLMGNKESRRTRQRRRQREEREREEAERYNAEAAAECTDLVKANDEQSADESGDDTEPDDERELEQAEARAMRDRQVASRREAEELEEAAMRQNLRDRGLIKDPKPVFRKPDPRRRGNNPQSSQHGMDVMRASLNSD